MTLEQLGDAKTGNVVEAPPLGVSRVIKRLICLCLAFICALWITPFAQAEDALGTMTDNITDPQNLLGANVSAVTDKVKQTKVDTGVTVRLLYVDSFGETAKPVDFVTQALESVDPDPNTVLLAVASGDGSLVVASSSNSDEWLRKESTIDALSKAAYDKLATSGEQDWSGAAIAMMDQIVREKKTHTSSVTVMAGVIGMAVALVALVVVVVVTVVLHRRKVRDGRKNARRRRGKVHRGRRRARRGQRKRHGYRKSPDANDSQADNSQTDNSQTDSSQNGGSQTDDSQIADSQRGEVPESIEQPDVAFQYTGQSASHSVDQSATQSVDQSDEAPALATETEVDPYESDR